jgi:hypothetical protein
MDDERRIRFLVAPILFVASLLLGALSDPYTRHFLADRVLMNPDGSKLIGLIAGAIAGGGVVVFALGYIFGTLNHLLLRLLFETGYQLRLSDSRFHEVALSGPMLNQVWAKLRADPTASEKERRNKELFVGAAFDHDVLQRDHEGVHQWMFRRWNAFNIAATSFLALVSSLPIGHLLHIPCTPTWCTPVVVFAAMLVPAMMLAWCETMNMLEFMIRLPPKRQRTSKGS